MTYVKICGITNLADANAALDAGADLLGFICYPQSPRYFPPDRIAKIVSSIQWSVVSGRTVGVFVNELPAMVQQILLQTGLDLAQLHGGESPAVVKQLSGRAFKALRPTSLTEAEVATEQFAHLGPQSGPDLLVDAYHSTAYGGTGQRADSGYRRCARSFPSPAPGWRFDSQQRS